MLLFSFSLHVVGCAGLPYFFARLAIAVGIAWPNHLAVFAICASVSQFVTSKLVSPGDINTGSGYAGCRWVEISVSCEEQKHTVEVHRFLSEEAFRLRISIPHRQTPFLGELNVQPIDQKP